MCGFESHYPYFKKEVRFYVYFNNVRLGYVQKKEYQLWYVFNGDNPWHYATESSKRKAIERILKDEGYVVIPSRMYR